MNQDVIYLTLSLVFSFFMAWGIGANDVANAMGTSVGARIFTLKQAILVAAVFEFSGSLLAGGNVTSTLSSGIINMSNLNINYNLLIFGMLASLLSSGIWLLMATTKGWPVSTTHSIVGALVGFACVGIGPSSVNWLSVFQIATSWIISPIMGAVIAFLIFLSVQKLILNQQDPFTKAKQYVPYYIFAVGFIISYVTLTRGLRHLNLNLSYTQGFLISITIGVILLAIGLLLIHKIKPELTDNKKAQFHSVEKIFGVLMIFTACSMAFAHGSNDVANAVSPLAAIIDIVHNKQFIPTNTVNYKVLLLGGSGIVLGLATFGYKVIYTIGKEITELTPSRGFAAEFAAATTVVLASGFGIPVSTTHTLVGAVLGVGFARGIEALNMKVIKQIFMSWAITLPAGALLSILLFYVFKMIFT